MVLRVTRSALETLRAETAQVAPDECCGLLLGHGMTVLSACPARNVAAEPSRRFEIDPQALFDAHRAERSGGPAVIGYYHSHPAGPARPSPTDQAQSPRDGRVWAIVGSSDVTFWRDGDRGFTPLSYDVADG